ncbi:MAG: M24 family metallopeptidase [Planctomycetaceae bacterium]|nr:M24 family metallopeptidase [Planctomycetaceae bacterium]
MADESRRRRHLVQDPQRLADVELKHDRVRSLLTEVGADALLLQDPANIAWFAAGADVTRFATDPYQTSLFITPEARLFATNAVDSTMIFEREAFGLGFQLKQREWYQPHTALVDDLSRGRKVISDSGAEGTRSAARRIASVRLPLTELEVDRLRRLARVLVHAVELTARNVTRGTTEAAVAGELSHRLIKRTVLPIRIQVCADGRNQRYRHWGFGEDAIESYASVSCVARRWGLHVAMTRTVVLDRVPPELLEACQKAVLIHGTGIFFSRHGRPLNEIWPRVHRIYEKFGVPDEWQMADQADITGYRSSEHQLTPENPFVLTGPVPIFWHPSVDVSMMGDTVLVTEQGTEFLTRSDSWPEMTVQVRGHEVRCPTILRLPRVEGSGLQETAKQGPSTPFNTLDFADEGSQTSRMDSIWEMDLKTDDSIFDDDEVAYPEESVLDG